MVLLLEVRAMLREGEGCRGVGIKVRRKRQKGEAEERKESDMSRRGGGARMRAEMWGMRMTKKKKTKVCFYFGDLPLRFVWHTI
jgi:hypothetical protein